MVIQTGLFSDNHFYRTSPMDPVEQNNAEKLAISQEDRIYNYLKSTMREMTAWQLKDVFPEYEITSLRRALFYLKNRSCLIEQTGWVKERKGVNCGKYKAL